MLNVNCPRCQNNSFAVVTKEMEFYKPVPVVACRSCGAVVGTLDPKISELEEKLVRIEASIRQLASKPATFS